MISPDGQSPVADVQIKPWEAHRQSQELDHGKDSRMVLDCRSSLMGVFLGLENLVHDNQFLLIALNTLADS